MLLYMYYLGSLSRGTNHDHIFQAFRAAILDYGMNTNTNTNPCPLSPHLGLWRMLEVPDWGLAS